MVRNWTNRNNHKGVTARSLEAIIEEKTGLVNP